MKELTFPNTENVAVYVRPFKPAPFVSIAWRIKVRSQYVDVALQGNEASSYVLDIRILAKLLICISNNCSSNYSRVP